jgi:hypothetical protein
MKTEITEKLITRIWQQRLIVELVTDMGQQLKVIHPGRRSGFSGCDFQDTLFAINGKTMTGNIELHVKSSQWYSHGHHRDPKYNNIALHIVWWHDSPHHTLLQNGKAIPTICLSSLFSNSPDELNNLTNLSGYSQTLCPKASSHSSIEGLNKVLAAAGEKRFATKIASFRNALKKEEVGQVLFRGIARALGYAQNAEACEELTSRLPLGFLEKAEPKADITRQALILGTAGLLPSQRARWQDKLTVDKEIDKLEAAWHSNSIAETMKESDWCFFRVRPDNFPTRRLIALSYLLARYGESGLLPKILQLIKRAPSGTEHRWLESSLVIAAQGYWENHFDFGIAMNGSTALLGREKASVIVTNAILPFACSWADLSSDLKLKKKAADIYRRYPSLGENELTRYMMQQLKLKPNPHLSVCQQQGLIHIFKTYCRLRDCTVCPVALSQG